MVVSLESSDFQIFSEKYGTAHVTVFCNERIESMAQEAQALLSLADNSPEVLAREIEPFEADGWTADAIRKEVMKSIPYSNPTGGGEGDDPDGLGSYIKQFIAILREAQNSNLSVIHWVQMEE